MASYRKARVLISDEIEIVRRRYSYERDVAALFAMDAIMLGHLDTVKSINRISDEAHHKAITCIELYCIVRWGLAE